MFKREIGRIHPEFFTQSSIFKKFRVSFKDSGDVELKSFYFTLSYSLGGGVLSCDDKDVLLDFEDIIKRAYGTNISRDEFKKTIDFDSIQTDYSVLNVGTCYFRDSYAGWDGSINAMWFDNKPPAEVLHVHFQYWSRKLLSDAWKLTEDSIKEYGGVDSVIPNLVDSLFIIKDSGKRKKLNSLMLNLL